VNRYPNYLDDDRPISVNNIIVNEASPYAVFTVSGLANQVVRLNLINGTATVGTDTGNSLEYNSGSGWVAYTANADLTLAGTALLVRTTITQDANSEGLEAFTLGVTKQSSGTTVYGTGSIYDDGTGEIYIAGNTTGTPDISGMGYPATLDDDRTIAINSPTVNEGSNIAIFTITGNSGETASLTLINESSNGTVTGKANIPTSQTLQIWDGLDWVNYDTTSLPTFDANGKIFVSVGITNEQDTPYEGAEIFKLYATLTGQTTVVTGTGTIIDDGSSAKYTGTFTSGSPTTSTVTLDDDRTGTLTVNSITVNEASPYAVFTVTGVAGQQVSLALGNTAATTDVDVTLGTDTGNAGAGAALQYLVGTTWTNYTSGTVSIATGGTTLLVRTAITNDSAYEGAETFTLTATPTSGTAAIGIATIVDDGTGVLYPDNTTGATGTGTRDDDRTLSVNAITVNEASPFAVFTVTGVAGQQVSLALGNTAVGTDVDATLGTDTGNAGATVPLQYYNGTAWVDYTPASTVTITGGTTLLVRTAITNDSAYEGAETFTLTATPTSGTYLFTPPPSKATHRPASGVGVVEVDVFGHQAGRSPFAAPALHRFADEVVGHA
jgi:hypothetical protein